MSELTKFWVKVADEQHLNEDVSFEHGDSLSTPAQIQGNHAPG